ncbi:ACP phosphodiesterase [Shewanella glacialipiscicola]|uniref:acyl carrier protein phosphodiesterase n=1 Tax=Shewanella glacialipiscicola TaxID=614069 RepID=UPI003D7A8815
MNFLTHLHLADISKTHLAANVAGNYIQAPISQAPMELRQALWLNQEINALCASHELTLELMEAFPVALKSIAAELMAVSFDHYLAYYWEEYHPEPLDAFSQKAYGALASFAAQGSDPYHPQSLLTLIPTMHREDWLGSYTTEQGLRRALTQVAKQHPQAALFKDSHKIINKMQIEIETAFRTFYPQLMAYSRIWGRKTPAEYLPSTL